MVTYALCTVCLLAVAHAPQLSPSTFHRHLKPVLFEFDSNFSLTALCSFASFNEAAFEVRSGVALKVA